MVAEPGVLCGAWISALVSLIPLWHLLFVRSSKHLLMRWEIQPRNGCSYFSPGIRKSQNNTKRSLSGLCSEEVTFRQGKMAPKNGGMTYMLTHHPSTIFSCFFLCTESCLIWRGRSQCPGEHFLPGRCSLVSLQQVFWVSQRFLTRTAGLGTLAHAWLHVFWADLLHQKQMASGNILWS